MARRATGRYAFVLLATMALAGCALAPGATDPAAAHQRAQAVLSAWAEAVAAAGEHAAVTPVGELTGQIGDWEEAVGDNNKRALMAGMVASDQPAIRGGAARRRGGVAGRDDDEGAPPLGAGSHRRDRVHHIEAPCSDCAMLLVTAARLTSGPIQTSRGPATAPIWEFTVQGTAVKVTRVAIANPVVVAPDEVGSQLGLAIDSASGTVGGTELTVAFVGAPDPGDMPCGEDYTAEAVESDLAVVVIVTRHPHAHPSARRARPSGRGARLRPRWPPRSATESCSTCSREPRSPSC